MKKLFLALFAVLAVSSLCFLGGPFAAFGEDNSAASASRWDTTITGKVDSVATGGAGPQITVRDDNWDQNIIMVASDTKITGKDGNPTTLTWVKGNRVFVEFITKNGVRTAKSIKVLPEA